MIICTVYHATSFIDQQQSVKFGVRANESIDVSDYFDFSTFNIWVSAKHNK